jgi:hypothetical protein
VGPDADVIAIVITPSKTVITIREKCRAAPKNRAETRVRRVTVAISALSMAPSRAVPAATDNRKGTAYA